MNARQYLQSQASIQPRCWWNARARLPDISYFFNDNTYEKEYSFATLYRALAARSAGISGCMMLTPSSMANATIRMMIIVANLRANGEFACISRVEPTKPKWRLCAPDLYTSPCTELQADSGRKTYRVRDEQPRRHSVGIR